MAEYYIRSKYCWPGKNKLSGSKFMNKKIQQFLSTLWILESALGNYPLFNPARTVKWERQNNMPVSFLKQCKWSGSGVQPYQPA